MSDDRLLRPATTDEIADALAFALRFDGRKRVHHGDELMARITAERPVRHLERSGLRRNGKAALAAAHDPADAGTKAARAACKRAEGAPRTRARPRRPRSVGHRPGQGGPGPRASRTGQAGWPDTRAPLRRW